ncbi:MAG: hypothetical protein WC761_05280 [Candidatus Paceibacterota bacterium]|jgi:hypothetical protein
MGALKNKKIIGVIAAIVVIIAAYYMYVRVSGDREVPYKVPVLSEKYDNTEHKFSLMMPKGFTARESELEGVDTIVFENDKSEGIQIVISPFDDVKELTKSMIQADIPDMEISDEQTVEIGDNHKGLAFKSDNDSFNGESREVWFVFQGKLFQISTYERFDELLQEMFATWSFNLN